MPSKHSNIGGSIAGRIIQCPWSLHMAHMAKVETGSNPAAAEGTALHALLEAYYKEEIADLEGQVGQTWEGVTLDEDQIERAVDASRALDAYLDQLEEEIGEKCELWFEAKVQFDLGSDLKNEDAFGTCDVLGRCGYVMFACDYKFGQQIVPAEDNPQLLFYTDAARSTLKELQDCTHVEMSIIQPANDNLIDTWKTTPERLEEFADELVDAVLTARELDDFVKRIEAGGNDGADVAEYGEAEESACNTGKYCQWCPLEFICPKKRQEAAIALEAAVPQQDPDLADWLNKLPALESFVSAVKARALEVLEAGGKVKGWKLVDRRANRVWEDVDKMITFAHEQGLSTEEISSVSFDSPAQLEKKLGKGVSLPEDLWTKRSSGHTIAPESDKRPDVNAGRFQTLRLID